MGHAPGCSTSAGALCVHGHHDRVRVLAQPALKLRNGIQADPTGVDDTKVFTHMTVETVNADVESRRRVLPRQGQRTRNRTLATRGSQQIAMGL